MSGPGREMKRPPALLRLLLQYSFYWVTTALFVNLLGVTWLLVLTGQQTLSPAGPDTSLLVGSPALSLFSAISILMGVLLSVWLAGRFLDRRAFADFGFHLNGGWWLDLFFGMTLGALLMTSIFLVELSLGWATVTGAFETIEPGMPFALGMLLPVVVFWCTGVSEEMLFRGYELRNAAEGFNYPALGPRGAILAAWGLSSIIFGLHHLGNPNATPLSTFNIALAGLLLGLGYVLTGELAIPIGLHITWNYFQGNVYGLPVSGHQPLGAALLSVEQGGPRLWTGGAFGPEAGLLEPVAVLAGCLLIAVWVRLRRGKAAIHTPIAEGPKQNLAARDTPAAD
jgi:uncharacterized protein